MQSKGWENRAFLEEWLTDDDQLGLLLFSEEHDVEMLISVKERRKDSSDFVHHVLIGTIFEPQGQYYIQISRTAKSDPR